jgi:hypothetical protein
MRRFLARTAAVALLAVGALAAATPAFADTVANPGPFTLQLTGGELHFGLAATGFPISIANSQLGGQIDGSGNVSFPGSSVQLAPIPFDTTQDVQGTTVHVAGTVSLGSTGLSGTLDPASGAASVTGGVYASINFTATATIFGVPTQLYSGTCSHGSAASPIQLALTTNAPGVPYSETTGAVTLASGFTAPSLSNCSPAINPLYAFLLDAFGGQGSISLSGTTDPVLHAPASSEPTGTQTVTATVGEPVLTMSVPSSVSFPTLFPGQTSAPVAAPVTVSTNNPGGYQFTVVRTEFTAGDIPLSIVSDPPSDPGMVLDILGLTPIPVGVSNTDALVVGHRSGSPSQANGDVWPTSLVLGPVPSVPPGEHTTTLTYTIVGF